MIVHRSIGWLRQGAACGKKLVGRGCARYWTGLYDRVTCKACKEATPRSEYYYPDVVQIDDRKEKL